MTNLVPFDLYPADDEPLAAKIRRAGQARALSVFAGEVEKAAKAHLRTAVDAEAERTGTGFSAKVDGVRATLSDPQPRPHVVDVDKFQSWWIGEGLEHQTTDRVEVVDHAKAATSMFALENMVAADLGTSVEANLYVDLYDSLRVATEYVLPEKPLDVLTASGRCTATDDGLIDTETGELVPGVECNRTAAVLSVSPDKQAKARDTAVVRRFFGVPTEISGAA